MPLHVAVGVRLGSNGVIFFSQLYKNVTVAILIGTATIKKNPKNKITSVGHSVEKQEELRTVGGNIKWCSHCGRSYGASSKN